MTTFIGYELTEVLFYHLSFSAAHPSVWGLKNMGNPEKIRPTGCSTTPQLIPRYECASAEGISRAPLELHRGLELRGGLELHGGSAILEG